MNAPDNAQASSALRNGYVPGAPPLGGNWFDAANRPARAPVREVEPAAPARHRAVDEASPLFHRHVLSPGEFAQRMQREKRRSERTDSPLSLVVYRMQSTSTALPEAFDALLDTLREGTRELDVLGRLGDGSIALLCIDTDAKGVRALIEKLGEPLAELPFIGVSATYPDRLFEGIEQRPAAQSDGLDLLASEGTLQTRRGYPLKRTLDVILALLAIVLTAPLMLLTALAIACESRGPIIYRQVRLGLGGVPFVFYKFRSMWTGVDHNIHRDFVLRLIEHGEEEKQPASRQANPYKLRSDSRITRVGRVIRKTSIDELPQLFNVLKGDMSLVGPRPPIPYEAANYQPWHLRRVLAVKPGITGMWQVEGRSRVSFNEMVRMDLRYAQRCSLALDLKIMVKTVAVVLSCDGAR